MRLQIILQARHVSYCGPWPWQICAHVGNSLMLSGEAGHNISAEEHSRQFLLSNQGQRMRPRWQERPRREQMIPTESESRARFVNRGNNEGWALRLKSILDICYGCSYNSLGVFIWHLLSWLLGRRFILRHTIPGDILSPGEWRVSGCQPHTLDRAAH